MKNWIFLFLMMAVISCSEKENTTNNNLTADTDNGGITLPEGFSALVVAEETGRGRHISVNTNGDIYVSLRDHSENKGIACLRGDKIAQRIPLFWFRYGSGQISHATRRTSPRNQLGNDCARFSAGKAA